MKTQNTMAFASKALLFLALGLPLLAQTNAPCGLDSSNNPIPHCVILTWTASTSPSVVYHVYKAPGPCPAAGTDLTKVIPPFAVMANSIGAQSIAATTYTDTSISPGTYSYYVTADSNALGSGGNAATESIPSNCAQALVPGVWPPTITQVTIR